MSRCRRSRLVGFGLWRWRRRVGRAGWAGTRCWSGRTCRSRRWSRTRSPVRGGGCSSRCRACRWCSRRSRAIFGPIASAGSWAGLAVEGLDLLGDGEVLVGDGAVGDLGVAQGHVQAAVAEQRGDGLQAHAAVDGLGGQGVPQLVGVDVGQPGGGAGSVDHPGDGVPVQGSAVLPGQQQRVPGRDVRGAVVVDQGDQVRVQRQVAVLAELADRDVQPVGRRRSARPRRRAGRCTR